MKLYNHTCNKCNKEFNNKRIVQKFCSRDCYYEDKRNVPNGRKIIKQNFCYVCNKQVQRQKAIRRNGVSCDKIFCSRKCYLKVHKEKIIKRKCKGCLEVFSQVKTAYTKEYCTLECNYIHKQYKATIKHNIKAVTIDNKFYLKECKICNTLFQVKKQKAINTICSEKCRCEFMRTNRDRKIKISRATLGSRHHNYIQNKPKMIKDRLKFEDRKYIFDLFDNKCFKCNNTKTLEIDHHIPFSRGGKLSINNSVILCKSCNCSKNAKMPKDFYTQKQLNKLEKLGIYSNSLFNI